MMLGTEGRPTLQSFPSWCLLPSPSLLHWLPLLTTATSASKSPNAAKARKVLWVCFCLVAEKISENVGGSVGECQGLVFHPLEERGDIEIDNGLLCVV